MGGRSGNSGSRPINRLLTVDEALQYSPLSSIVPFGPETLPVPRITTSSTSLLFATANEEQASKAVLERMNREAHRSNAQTALATQSIQGLQQVLDPEMLSGLKFKQPADFGLHPGPNSLTQSSNGRRSIVPQLGLFAQRVFDATSLASECLPSEGSDITKAKGALNQQLERAIVPFSIADSASLEEDILQPCVVIPGLPSNSQREDYEVYPQPPQSSEDEREQTAPSRTHDTKRVNLASNSAPNSTDERKKADIALRNLQELIAQIFEAEDHLEPDSSGAQTSSFEHIFLPWNSNDENGPILTAEVQAQVDSLTEKVLHYGKFAEIPFDQLVRLQKLIEAALKSTDAVNVKLDDSLVENELDSWLQNAAVIEGGLQSARLLLRIVTGRRGERQIYSEEILQSTLNLLKTLLDVYIIPVVEMRSAGSQSELFKSLASQKQVLVRLLVHVIKILKLLIELLSGHVLAETAVTTMEFLAISLIFVENAHMEKDSVLGMQKCERLRIVAMDLLVEIFSLYPAHRTFIFDEILTSLEKLPVTRQKARHYKLADGKNIQLVSALVMGLVQTSAMLPTSEKPNQSLPGTHSRAQGNTPKKAQPSSSGIINDSIDGRDQAAAINRLADLVQPLMNNAQRNAQYVIQFLVSRALKSTKTGDDPYRVLLDIFAEDFLAVLGSMDWPASEMLLRSLLTSMINLTEGEKTIAPARNMALDLMGMMGAALSDVTTQIRTDMKTMDNTGPASDCQLVELAEDFLKGRNQHSDLLSWDGPYRLVIDHLQSRQPLDRQLLSAREFLLIQWATKLCSASEEVQDRSEGDEHVRSVAALSGRLESMIVSEGGNDIERPLGVNLHQAQLAYALVVMNLPFGGGFERILIILLNSMNSDHATVRSKSMKSVIQLIERDPTILDRGNYVLRYILKRASDPSPLVRDSAIGLIGKCLTLRPNLESDAIEPLLARSADAQVGVRKRSMKLLRDIYLRSSKQEFKVAIAEALLQRMDDEDESVLDLAKQLLEEMWLLPLCHPTDDDQTAARRSLALKAQASLIVKTVQRGSNVSTPFSSFLQGVLSEESKTRNDCFRACKDLVAVLFDEIVAGGESAERTETHLIMPTLTIFAKANSRLFEAEQLEHLQIYLEHLSHNDDLHIFRSVVVIFRWVLPHLGDMKSKFLMAVQKALLESLTKLGKKELNEVVACLWTINKVLKTIERLSKVTISCIKSILGARNTDLKQDAQRKLITSVTRYINIAGLFGKYCDFNTDISRFRTEFPWWKGDAVPALLIDVLAPFTAPKQPFSVRSAALDAVGAVCQSSPKLFLRDQVATALDIVFAESNRDLESLVLNTLREFLTQEEKRSEKHTEFPQVPSADHGSGRLDGGFTANQNDGVATSLAQRYLQQAIRVAMASQDDHALNAVEVIASISRQGLVHPRDCVSVLVALETSIDVRICTIAFREHRLLHQKHETIVEKQYMKAVQDTFQYQKDIVGEVRGAKLQPLSSKLQPLFDVLKASKVKLRTKFLTNLCSKAVFDPSDVNLGDEIPVQLEFGIFIADNLAYSSYAAVADIIQVISCIEQQLSGTGTAISHALETEMFGPPQPTAEGVLTEPDAVRSRPQHISPARLRQLAASSLVLYVLWETRTYLRRVYGVEGLSKRREAKNKLSVKETNKVPTRVSGVSGQALWDNISTKILTMGEVPSMITTCKEFYELMTVDRDFKVAKENETSLPTNDRPETPSDDASSVVTSAPEGSGKSRKRKAGSTGPVKDTKKSRRRGGSRARRSGSLAESWD